MRSMWMVGNASPRSQSIFADTRRAGIKLAIQINRVPLSVGITAQWYLGRRLCLPYVSALSLSSPQVPNLMQSSPTRSLRPHHHGVAWLRRLLAVCAGLHCADLTCAEPIHGTNKRYPTVTYTDTDVPSTDVPTLNLRISPLFRLK